MPVPGVRFLYIGCNDLSRMRTFYSDLVGLDEIYYSDDDRTLGYDCDGFQFTVIESTEAAPADSRWDRQPGWVGGTRAAVSWSVALTESTFGPAVERLGDAGVPCFRPTPVWVGYWSFPVKDPMGNTVEITYAPADPPTSTDWQAILPPADHCHNE